MKALKTIGIILAAIIALVLVLGLIAPRTVATEKSIVINAPREVIFPYLQYFVKQQTWSPWNERDPNMKTEIIGTDGTVGAINRWESKTEGTGEQEITSLVSNERLETHLRFRGQGEADAFLAAKDAEGGTEVTWGFSATTPYPLNFMNLFMDIAGMVGKDYDAGLNKLKVMMELLPKTDRDYDVKVMDSPAKYYIGLRKTVAMQDMQKTFAENLPKVFEAVQKAGIEMAGAPCGLYFSWDEANQSSDMAFAIPIKTKASVKGFETIEIPAGKILLIDYFGAYEGIGEAHFAMDDYIKEHNLQQLAPICEAYVTDPQTEPDTAKWLTKVYYPVQNK